MAAGAPKRSPCTRTKPCAKGSSNALARGFKLGVWANSDHISTHTSFGGVYVKDFTREGIIEGLNARRTIAATDKVFVEFTCNGHLMGTEIELAGKPYLAWKVDGTADVKRVTLVRNEKDLKQWEPGTRVVAVGRAVVPPPRNPS